jgi:hypothetical protein
VDPRAGLDDVEKLKFLPHRDLKSDLSVVQPVASRYPGCIIIIIIIIIIIRVFLGSNCVLLSWKQPSRFFLAYRGFLCSMSALQVKILLLLDVLQLLM